MKVLIITTDLNERSGRGTYPRAVVKELLAQGIDVGVCCEGDARVPYQVVRTRPLSGMSLVSFLLNARAIRIAARQFNLVHALDGWPFGVYGYLAVLGTRKRLFINGVGTYSVAPLYSFFSGLLLRKAYARAEKIFCISEYTKKQLAIADVPYEKLEVVHMGRTVLPEISEEQRMKYRERYGVQLQHPVILTVGEIKDRKGQLDTFKAVELLKQKYPDILHIAVGAASSGYAKHLAEYASIHGSQKNLLIVSDADDRALAFFYSICDVFALNSTTDQHHHFEGFGLVFLEAGQFGVPGIGTKDCGIEDAIVDGVTGVLVPQRNSPAIARVIETALEKRQEFGAAARAFSGTFSWQKTVEAYRVAYATLT
jgi:glycosyltransferase involved in cell wall biosynthesis